MLKWGFVGLGQGGGRIVDSFIAKDREHYVGIAVNTAETDLEGLKNIPVGNRLHLKGNRSGAGRTPEIAYRSLVEDNGAEFFALVNRVVAECDFVWIVAGLGGGTGTGTLRGVLEVVDTMFPVPVGLIVTTPRDADSKVEIANTIEILGHIQTAIDDQKIGSVVVVDNNRFYRQFAEEQRNDDWRDGSNEYISTLLHEMNTVTGLAGSSNFDATDFSKFLVEPGCLAIGQVKLRGTLEANGVTTQIQNAITKGFFASGYRFEEAKQYSISFKLNKAGSNVRSSAFEKHIEDSFAQMFPAAYEKYISYYETDEDSYVLSLVSGLGLPDRVFNLQERLKDIGRVEQRKFETSTQVSEQLRGVNHLLKQRTSVPTVANGNPWAAKQNSMGDIQSSTSVNPWTRK